MNSSFPSDSCGNSMRSSFNSLQRSPTAAAAPMTRRKIESFPSDGAIDVLQEDEDHCDHGTASYAPLNAFEDVDDEEEAVIDNKEPQSAAAAAVFVLRESSPPPSFSTSPSRSSAAAFTREELNAALDEHLRRSVPSFRFDPTDGHFHPSTPSSPIPPARPPASPPRDLFALPSTCPPVPLYDGVKGRTPFQVMGDDLPIVSCNYIRFVVSNLHGVSCGKLVPVRHRNKPLHVNSSILSSLCNNTFMPLLDSEKRRRGGSSSSSSSRLLLPTSFGNNIELLPDFSTERCVPWLTHSAKSDLNGEVTISQILCEVCPLGRELCPRAICRIQVERLLQETGVKICAAHEYEFTLCSRLPSDSSSKSPMKPFGASPFSTITECLPQDPSQSLFSPSPHRQYGPFLTTAAPYNSAVACKMFPLLAHLESGLSELGIDVMSITPSAAPAQIITTLAPKFGTAAADDAFNFKSSVKEMCALFQHAKADENVAATFMSVPFSADGKMSSYNSGHLNFSLWYDDSSDGDGKPSPLTFDDVHDVTKSSNPKSSFPPLTPLCKSFVAGILLHARAIHAFAAPTPACYLHHTTTAGPDGNHGGSMNQHHESSCCASKFYAFGKGCPATHINYVVDDHPATRNASGAFIRIKEACVEIRSPSAASNPYLVMASIIAAGLDGIDCNMSLVDAVDDDVANWLPASLSEALDALESNDLIVDAMGRDFVELFIAVKRNEIEAMKKASGGFSAGQVSSEHLEAALQAMYIAMI